MFAATLEIPADGNIGRSVYRGLSDEVALSAARVACRTLSDDNGECVVVTLSDGSVMTFGYDPVEDTIGTFRTVSDTN